MAELQMKACLQPSRTRCGHLSVGRGENLLQRSTLGLLQLWEALQRKLDRELHADEAARHSSAQAEAPAAGVMTLQMFSSNAQQRRRKVAETTAALSKQQQGHQVPSKLKRRQLTFGKHVQVRPSMPVLRHAATLLSTSSTDSLVRCRVSQTVYCLQVLQQATAMAVTSEAVCSAAAHACHSALSCVAGPEELDEQEEGQVVRTGGKQAIYEALSDPSAIHSKRIGDSRAAKKRRKQLAEQAQAAPTEPPASSIATVVMQSSAASGSKAVPAAGKKKRKGKAERKRDKQRAEEAQAALLGAENGG